MAPIATMTAAKRKAAGTTTMSVEAARVQGIATGVVAPTRRMPSTIVSDIEVMLSRPVIVESVATAMTLPVMRSNRLTGADRIVSSVPRSRSPAVMSMAG